MENKEIIPFPFCGYTIISRMDGEFSDGDNSWPAQYGDVITIPQMNELGFFVTYLENNHPHGFYIDPKDNNYSWPNHKENGDIK